MLLLQMGRRQRRILAFRRDYIENIKKEKVVRVCLLLCVSAPGSFLLFRLLSMWLQCVADMVLSFEKIPHRRHMVWAVLSALHRLLSVPSIGAL